jgi:hypothetical protein
MLELKRALPLRRGLPRFETSGIDFLSAVFTIFHSAAQDVDTNIDE